MASADSSRFSCQTSSLALRGLLGRSRAVMWACCFVAIGVHAGVSVLGTSQPVAKPAKPLTTRFVKRQPRLTKPLELKRVPLSKKRAVQREMVSVKARVTRSRTGIEGVSALQVAGRLASPLVDVSRVTALEAGAFEPAAVASVIHSSAESADRVDMALEMVDVGALDTGRHHAMVIQDPAEKRAIRGYFHFYRAYSVSMRSGEHGARWKDDARIDHGINRLIRALNEWTHIRSDVLADVTFDDAEMLKCPWVFASSHYGFRITDSEAVALGTYLMAGGFFFADAYRPEAPLGKSFRDTYRAALASQGRLFGQHWLFEALPNTHPLYHCFFDFDRAPLGYGINADLRALPRQIDGINLDGRLLGLMSNQGYTRAWSDYGPGGFAVITQSYPEHLRYDNTRQLQLGINTIIFALTQEGSITKRVMDTVQY